MGFIRSILQQDCKTTLDDKAQQERFQVHSNGSHSHHLTMALPHRLTDLVDGFLHGGFRHKEDPHTVQQVRKKMDAALERDSNGVSFASKWGHCRQIIGRGSFGVVRLVQKTPEARLYAVKEFRKYHSETTDNYVQRLTYEFSIGSRLHQTNVIEILDLLPLNDACYCQVMGYCDGGDLFHLIHRGLERLEADCLFKQLIRGVDYMHRMGIAHRDLKPENLLLTSDGCLKISDFGSAVCFEGIQCHGVVGSEPYIAPEEFTLRTYDAPKVDIWSCGMIYMAMRTGSHLWNVAKQGQDDEYDRYLTFRRLLEEERCKAKKETQQLDIAKKDCMIKAKESIKKKAGAYDVLKDLEMASKKLVYRLLDPKADKRILTPDIFNNEWFASIKTCLNE